MKVDFVSCGDPEAPCICFVDMVEHPFHPERVAEGLHSNMIDIGYPDWDDTLTPWPAKGLYAGDPDFRGLAGDTLAELLKEILPAAEAEHGLSPSARGIAGYSLGGLFALFAFTRSDAFSAVSSMSGSVWYEGWTESLEGLPFDGRGKGAFLSLGESERLAKEEILHSVQDRTCETAGFLRSRGCSVEVSIGPGNHFQHGQERVRKGLEALDSMLNGGSA